MFRFSLLYNSSNSLPVAIFSHMFSLYSHGISGVVFTSSRKLSTGMPRLLCTATPGTSSRQCSPSSSSEEIVSSMRSSHTVRDAPAKGQTSQTFVTQETLPKHITHRSLVMTGPAHICAQHVSVRLPGQPSGSSSELPREPSFLGILFGSAARCPCRKNKSFGPLRLSKTYVPRPSCFLKIFLTFDRLVHFPVFVIDGRPF